ncbi:MAG: hypothetical protein AAB776_03835 [Patescibacteria group bacterium]
MFEDRQVTQSTPSKPAPTSVGAASDIVIHTMPKEFYDREVKIKEEEKPKAPAPVVSPPPIAKPKPLPPPPRKRSKLGLVIVILLVMILLAVGALGFVYSQGIFSVSPVVKPTPDTTPDPEPNEVKPTPEPAKPISGADTDSDGLTNVEELLYGTDFRNPDSDSDTFLDGNEVFHRFDPRGLAPSTLLDTGAVRVLESVELPFAMYYPTTWNPVSTPASQRVTFRSATGAGVNVLWQDKAIDVSLESWYETQVGEVKIDRLQPTITKEGYRALIGPDERVMYVEAGDKVFTVVYDLVDAKSIEFLQTFKMMVNSFRLAHD